MSPSEMNINFYVQAPKMLKLQLMTLFFALLLPCSVFAQNVNPSSSSEIAIGEVVDMTRQTSLRITWDALKSIYTIRSKDDKNSVSFELSPAELGDFVSGYQEAARVSKGVPAGKMVKVWESVRENGSKIGTVASSVPGSYQDIVFVSIAGANEEPPVLFVVPTFWASRDLRATELGEISTEFDNLLLLALNASKAKTPTP